MDDWQTGDVKANGLRLRYTRTGGDKPPLVLAHGVTDSGMCWSPVAAALAPEYDVVMLDARGHGRSDAPERGYGSREQADDLAAAIAALRLRRPGVLGHSMGAATALVLAGVYPDVPGAILLEDPPAWWVGWNTAQDTRERLDGMRARAIGYQRKTREALIADKRAEEPGWSDAELQPWADAKQQFSPHALSVLDLSNPDSVEWSAILRRITCPVLLIVADPELDAIVTDNDAAALRSLVPHIEVVHIREAGHNIRRDQFARYMEVVGGFLTKHRAAIAS